MYRALSKWCGWFGGWGSESDIAEVLNREPEWQLIRTDIAWSLWFYFVPRKKLLMILHKPAG